MNTEIWRNTHDLLPNDGRMRWIATMNNADESMIFIASLPPRSNMPEIESIPKLRSIGNQLGLDCPVGDLSIQSLVSIYSIVPTVIHLGEAVPHIQEVTL